MTSTERQMRQAATSHYARWKFYHCYTIGKLALDPAYPVVAARLKDSVLPLLDIGCGLGLLEIYLSQHGHHGIGIALDTDAEKIRVAQEALQTDLPCMSFQCDNAKSLPNFSGDVVMLDVLHYFDPAIQRAILESILVRVAPGGCALIRIGLRQKNWRYAFTWIEELFIRLNGWIPVQGTNFPTACEVIAPFEKAGFYIKCEPMWGITPFNSYLFEFRRQLP